LFAQFPFEEAFHFGSILGREPMALHEEIGQGAVQAGGPGRARISELHGLEQSGLQSKDPEEQVLVGVKGRHGSRFAQNLPLSLLSNDPVQRLRRREG
jgi:hypothetical protein